MSNGELPTADTTIRQFREMLLTFLLSHAWPGPVPVRTTGVELDRNLFELGVQAYCLRRSMRLPGTPDWTNPYLTILAHIAQKRVRLPDRMENVNWDLLALQQALRSPQLQLRTYPADRADGDMELYLTGRFKCIWLNLSLTLPKPLPRRRAARKKKTTHKFRGIQLD